MGNFKDDTALNSIRLRCRSQKNWKNVKEIRSREGWWGSWKPWKECPKGHYLKSYDLKVEKDSGWDDDTSANGVRFKCSNGTVLKSGKAQKWGSWKTGQRCPTGYIGSFRTRVEEPQGETGDDTTLNGLEIGCRKTKSSSKQKFIKPSGKKISGYWGKWAPVFSTCPAGSYAYGFRVRVEKKQGKGDDTALNAIQLRCRTPSGSGKGLVKSLEGGWGSWSSWTHCAKGHFLKSYRMRVEKRQGNKDDTAANDVTFKCTNGKTLTASRRGPWGTWKNGQDCGNKGVISGLKTRVESSQKDKDDTALNGLDVQCSQRPK